MVLFIYVKEKQTVFFLFSSIRHFFSVSIGFSADDCRFLLLVAISLGAFESIKRKSYPVRSLLIVGLSQPVGFVATKFMN